VNAIHKHVEMDIVDEVLYLHIEHKNDEDIGESTFNSWKIVEQKIS
jgi:2-phosphoglycerate kinase